MGVDADRRARFEALDADVREFVNDRMGTHWPGSPLMFVASEPQAIAHRRLERAVEAGLALELSHEIDKDAKELSLFVIEPVIEKLSGLWIRSLPPVIDLDVLMRAQVLTQLHLQLFKTKQSVDLGYLRALRTLTGTDRDVKKILPNGADLDFLAVSEPYTASGPVIRGTRPRARGPQPPPRKEHRVRAPRNRRRDLPEGSPHLRPGHAARVRQPSNPRCGLRSRSDRTPRGRSADAPRKAQHHSKQQPRTLGRPARNHGDGSDRAPCGRAQPRGLRPDAGTRVEGLLAAGLLAHGHPTSARPEAALSRFPATRAGDACSPHSIRPDRRTTARSARCLGRRPRPAHGEPAHATPRLAVWRRVR